MVAHSDVQRSSWTALGYAEAFSSQNFKQTPPFLLTHGLKIACVLPDRVSRAMLQALHRSP